jgi:hypothetical protein
LELSIINTLRGLCLEGKPFLDSVVDQGRNQFRDLPITFEMADFAFRQQQRREGPGLSADDPVFNGELSQLRRGIELQLALDAGLMGGSWVRS